MNECGWVAGGGGGGGGEGVVVVVMMMMAEVWVGRRGRRREEKPASESEEEGGGGCSCVRCGCRANQRARRPRLRSRRFGGGVDPRNDYGVLYSAADALLHLAPPPPVTTSRKGGRQISCATLVASCIRRAYAASLCIYVEQSTASDRAPSGIFSGPHVRTSATPGMCNRQHVSAMPHLIGLVALVSGGCAASGPLKICPATVEGSITRHTDTDH